MGVVTGNRSYTAAAGVGATLTIRFHGSRLVLYGVKDITGGIASIRTDAGPARLVDMYASRLVTTMVFTTADLPLADHTVTVELTGRKDRRSAGTKVSFDRAVVFARTTPAS
jgi:hypothetical protein